MKRHLIALLVAAASVALALSACKKTRTTCTDPPENSRRDIDLDDDEKRMAEAALRDPTFCQELASPRITLANDELVLSGPTERRLARRAELSADEIRSVDRLFQSLRAYGWQLMKIRPTSHAKQEIDLRLDPSLETARAASIILSAAYAEYDRAKITTGAMTFPLLSYRRGPPDGAYTWSILHVEAATDSTVTVQVHGPVCNRSKAVTVPNRELGPYVVRLCAENKRTPDPADAPGEGPGRSITRCFDSVEVRALPHAPFGETASLLRAIVGALAEQKPTVDIALLLVGSEPKMKGMPRSPWGGRLMFAPGVESSAYCTLPDGGYDPDSKFDGGPLVIE